MAGSTLGTAIRSRGIRVFGQDKRPPPKRHKKPGCSQLSRRWPPVYPNALKPGAPAVRDLSSYQFPAGSLASGLALTLVILECLASWLSWPHKHKSPSLCHSQGAPAAGCTCCPFPTSGQTNGLAVCWEVGLANCATSIYSLLSVSESCLQIPVASLTSGSLVVRFTGCELFLLFICEQ